MSKPAKQIYTAVCRISSIFSPATSGSAVIVGTITEIGPVSVLGVPVAYIVGGVVAGAAGVVAGTAMGGVSLYRFRMLKRAYKEELSVIVKDLERLADMTHKEKVSLCKHVAK